MEIAWFIVLFTADTLLRNWKYSIGLTHENMRCVIIYMDHIMVNPLFSESIGLIIGLFDMKSGFLRYGLIIIQTGGSILNGIFIVDIPYFVKPLLDSKVHGANMGPIWGRQDPGGPPAGSMNFAIWADLILKRRHLCPIVLICILSSVNRQ